LQASKVMRSPIRSLAIATFALAIGASSARADTFFIPWAGTPFGSSLDNGRTSLGFSVGGMGAGVFGGEFDFGFGPGFFGNEDVFGNNNVLTASGNVLLGIPVGGEHGIGIRPYIVAGVGLLHADIQGTARLASLSDTIWGWDAGGGVMLFFADHIGTRVDLRELRGVQDLEGGGLDLIGNRLHFWRASLGFVIR